MKLSLLALASLAASVTSKNILLTNDDSFAATNIRATYYALKTAGHNVWLVAPVSQRSGWGGKWDTPSTPNLLSDGEFGYLKAGQPSFGNEPSDDHIWYFNGTPATSVSFGLDYILPHYFDNATIDLVVAGPNEGNNPDPFAFTSSGTMAATYYAVNRGIPAIAFSGANGTNSFYQTGMNDDPMNSANIYGNLVVDLVDTLFEQQGDNQRALPLSVGLNVNFPKVGSDSTTGCIAPKYIQTRLTGAQSWFLSVTYNSTTGVFGSSYLTSDAMGNCLNGECSLPGEVATLNSNACVSPISVFSIDYDAPLALTKETVSLFQNIL